MTGGVRCLSAALAIVAAGLAGCSDARASDGDGTLGVGDTWTMRVSIVEDPDEDAYEITMRHTVAAIGERRGIPAYEVDVDVTTPEDLHADDRTVTKQETLWLRIADLAVIEHFRHRHVILEDDEVDGNPYVSNSTTVMDRPCGGRPANLTVGMHWNETCVGRSTYFESDTWRGNDTFTHNRTERTSYRVVGQETVRVQAGTFAAFRIETNGTQGSDHTEHGTQWVSADSCGPFLVRSANHYANDEHEGDSTMELVAMQC